MPNPNDKDREQSHEDALKALHGMGASDDETDETDEVGHEQSQETPADDSGPSPSASGFVGMLAKQGKGGPGDTAAGLDASEAASPSPDPDPAKPSTPAGTDRIYMAKEIKEGELPEGTTPLATTPAATTPLPVPAPSAAASAKTARRVKPAPGWYHAAVPVMYTLSAILIIIGFWAVGAMIYMHMNEPRGAAVAYPFLYAEEDVLNAIPDIFIYTRGSRLIAMTMLACLPVSLALGIMAGIMQRHIRATRQA